MRGSADSHHSNCLHTLGKFSSENRGILPGHTTPHHTTESSEKHVTMLDLWLQTSNRHSTVSFHRAALTSSGCHQLQDEILCGVSFVAPICGYIWLHYQDWQPAAHHFLRRTHAMA